MADPSTKLTPILPADSGTWPKTLSGPSKDLLNYWVSKCPDGGYPKRSAIEPGEIALILPHIYIVERLGGEKSDYRFLLVGTFIVAVEGEHTGQLLSEMLPDRDLHASIWTQYDECCLGTIYVRRENLGWRGKTYIDYEVVLLPLYGGDENVEYLIGTAYSAPLPGSP